MFIRLSTSFVMLLGLTALVSAVAPVARRPYKREDSEIEASLSFSSLPAARSVYKREDSEIEASLSYSSLPAARSVYKREDSEIEASLSFSSLLLVAFINVRPKVPIIVTAYYKQDKCYVGSGLYAEPVTRNLRQNIGSACKDTSRIDIE
ncbi:hypothetical protein CY34DRAFT_651075 [Suillus luteus UH-Slu-Lm8-n1]|uniref:Uncharacterized protein n=1 Tax=Suillus luteus UH-Slu-Lm8-n1 TaxID=930992 RepID=A0A0D0BD44_9AGAM|nr:hypothetical protein CY34DRAFT_651075 [Suillus luteus UH-Slu-Lm8-n1]